jgi:hypothetical protein
MPAGCRGCYATTGCSLASSGPEAVFNAAQWARRASTLEAWPRSMQNKGLRRGGGSLAGTGSAVATAGMLADAIGAGGGLVAGDSVTIAVCRLMEPVTSSRLRSRLATHALSYAGSAAKARTSAARRWVSASVERGGVWAIACTGSLI